MDSDWPIIDQFTRYVYRRETGVIGRVRMEIEPLYLGRGLWLVLWFNGVCPRPSMVFSPYHLLGARPLPFALSLVSWFRSGMEVMKLTSRLQMPIPPSPFSRPSTISCYYLCINNFPLHHFGWIPLALIEILWCSIPTILDPPGIKVWRVALLTNLSSSHLPLHSKYSPSG